MPEHQMIRIARGTAVMFRRFVFLWGIALAVATVLYYQRRKVTGSLGHLLRQR